MSDAAVRATGAPRHRLSRRLAWLMVAALLVIEALVFLPSLVRSRTNWFERRMTEAELAAMSGAAAPDGMVERAVRDELLRLTGAEAITLQEPGGMLTVLAPHETLPGATPLNFRDENMLTQTGDAVAGLFPRSDRLLALTATSGPHDDDIVTAIVHRAELDHALVAHLRRVGSISLVIAAAVGLMLYFALQYVLVRPLRKLTESIAAFRADPERSLPLDPVIIDPRKGGGEIAAAGLELAAMQQELRASLWRNARLAALGTAMAKVSHDLRGILSPALLTAERLQMNEDPKVKRAGDILVRAVERATDLASRTLEFASDSPAVLTTSIVALRAIVDEAAEQAISAVPGLTVRNTVDASIRVEADRDSLLRVMANLLRNAGEAEARNVQVACAVEDQFLALTVTDDGPGLPEKVQARLFRPFVTGTRRGSTGLGLAIVRDLMRAHGGDVSLVSTGASGTCFRLTLPARHAIASATVPAMAGR